MEDPRLGDDSNSEIIQSLMAENAELRASLHAAHTKLRKSESVVARVSYFFLDIARIDLRSRI